MACRSTRHRAAKRKATELPRPRKYDAPTDFEHDRQDINSTRISDAVLINPQQSAEQQSVVPLYEGSSLTCASSGVLVMKYAIKHNITKALSDLLDLLRLHCPKPNSV